MSTRRRTAAALVAVGLAVLVAAPAPSGAADGPSLRLTPDLAPTGTRVTAELEGWTGATSVVIELCGRAPSPRSSDCDLAGSEGGNVPESGSALLELVVGTPPTPCPCVVRVRAADGTGPVASAPIVLTDLAAVADPQPAADPPLRSATVDRVRLGGAGLGAWFGLANERTLTFRVRNTGDVALDGAQANLRVRDGGAAKVVPAPVLHALAPGEAVTVSVLVPGDALTSGSVEVDGRLYGVDDPVAFEASTSQPPFGLVALVVLVLAGLVALVVRRRRGRREPHDSEPQPGEPQASPIA